MMHKNEEIIKELVETGADISGGIAGAVIGGLIAGPVGMVIGGVSGPIITKSLKKIGEEIRSRFLSPREEIRIGAAYGFAIHKLQKYQEIGILIRNDSFFDAQETERPDSEEIFEGVILGAQKEYEERKVKFLGYLYANICINSEISREHANQLIRTINILSYRQLCLLQLFQKKAFENIIEIDNIKIDVVDIITEIRDLNQKGLLSMTARLYDVNDNSIPIPISDIKITDFGALFCKLLSLDEITDEELRILYEKIKHSP